MKRVILLLLLLGFGQIALASERAIVRDGRGFALAVVPYAFHFPRDHGAHNAYKSEWWYYTGHLLSANHRRFGYELTFFRVGLHPGSRRLKAGESDWRGTQYFPAHFAITDATRHRFVYFEEYAREALGAGFASEARLEVRTNAWWLRGTNPMHLHAEKAGNGVDLEQFGLKAPAVHGMNGISRKAACRSCASHYYSMTRLRTSGTIKVAGETLHVSGKSWMDHEFGSDELLFDQSGWDWFSVQLDDGRDLMFYRLREKNGSVTAASSGSLIARSGLVQHLPLSAVRISSSGTWTSPHTGAVYPSGWRISVARAGIDVVLHPVESDQELANTQNGISYWEGAADVNDPVSGHHLGDAYVELTGYAGPVNL